MAWITRFRNFVSRQPFSGVTAEAEAYLKGTYRQLLERRRQEVPMWAWINCLAHGERECIERLAATDPGRGPGEYLAVMAREVLAGLDKDTLAAVQRERLIPLELAIGADRVLRPPRTGDDLARAVQEKMGTRLRPIRLSGSEQDRTTP